MLSRPPGWSSSSGGGADAGIGRTLVRRPRRFDDTGLFDAEAVGEEAEQPLPLGLVEAGALHAPAVELQATVHGAILPRIRPGRGR